MGWVWGYGYFMVEWMSDLRSDFGVGTMLDRAAAEGNLERSSDDLPLVEVLRQYQAWDDREAQHRAAILALLETHPNAFDRQSDQPGHITGSAWVIAIDTQQVALIHHRKLKHWLQPGGHAEAGETDGKSTVLREVQEELGLTLEACPATLFDLDVHRIPATATQPSHFHFDLRYLFLIPHQPLTAESDADQARWFSAVELESIEMDESMQRMFLKSRERGWL